jgi:exonuclease SbcD
LISQLARPRLPELGAVSSLDPIEALQTYLTNREDLQEIAAEMLEAAQALFSSETEWESQAKTEEEPAIAFAQPASAQLRLL